MTGQHENTCKLHEVLCASLVPCLAQTSEYTRIVQCTWNYMTGDQPRPAIFFVSYHTLRLSRHVEGNKNCAPQDRNPVSALTLLCVRYRMEPNLTEKIIEKAVFYDYKKK